MILQSRSKSLSNGGLSVAVAPLSEATQSISFPSGSIVQGGTDADISNVTELSGGESVCA
ncbi:MAG: hypothetical protein WAL24_00200 [Nitrososphaeraceae archaeon]